MLPSTRRDLAEQTHNNFTAFRKFLADPALRNELFVGGTNPQVSGAGCCVRLLLGQFSTRCLLRCGGTNLRCAGCVVCAR